MSLTLDEIIERMSARYDPDEIVELLEITTEELLEAFSQRLLENYEDLCEELEE